MKVYNNNTLISSGNGSGGGVTNPDAVIFRAKCTTNAEMNALTDLVDNSLIIVESDETLDGNRMTYIYKESEGFIKLSEAIISMTEQEIQELDTNIWKDE